VIGLDTNVLIRHLVGDDLAQTKLVDNLLDRRCSTDEPVFINRIVLCETAWTLDRTYGYNRREIAKIIESMLLAREFSVEDRDDVSAALVVYKATNIGFTDALIGELNRTHGCEFTATFDRKAAKLVGFELLS